MSASLATIKVPPFLASAGAGAWPTLVSVTVWAPVCGEACGDEVLGDVPVVAVAWAAAVVAVGWAAPVVAVTCAAPPVAVAFDVLSPPPQAASKPARLAPVAAIRPRKWRR